MKTFIQAGSSQFVTSHLDNVKIRSEVSHSVCVALLTCLEKIRGWRREREGAGGEATEV